MSKTYSEQQYIWAVNRECEDDSLCYPIAYFTVYKKAQEFCNKNKLTRVVQTTLLKDNLGQYYKMPFLQTVLVDAPTKEEVLGKLSDIERKVLGV